jgi:hypothetical protein
MSPLPSSNQSDHDKHLLADLVLGQELREGGTGRWVSGSAREEGTRWRERVETNHVGDALLDGENVVATRANHSTVLHLDL